MSCKEEIVENLRVTEDSIHLDLWYPPYPPSVGKSCFPWLGEERENPKYLVLGLMATRAADDIRISYDYGRDGWKIEQASRFAWPASDPVCDPDWQEVAFVKAWAREQPYPTADD